MSGKFSRWVWYFNFHFYKSRQRNRDQIYFPTKTTEKGTKKHEKMGFQYSDIGPSRTVISEKRTNQVSLITALVYCQEFPGHGAEKETEAGKDTEWSL